MSKRRIALVEGFSISCFASGRSSVTYRASSAASTDDHLSVLRLEEEHHFRKPLAVALARTAADVELLVVVADELPPGAATPETGRSLTATRRPDILPAVEPVPHVVRVVVWSAAERRVVLRARGAVDARRRSSRCTAARRRSSRAARDLRLVRRASSAARS